jgi:hypothetical protein
MTLLGIFYAMGISPNLMLVNKAPLFGFHFPHIENTPKILALEGFLVVYFMEPSGH